MWPGTRGTGADALHVLDDARGEILEGEPFDEMAVHAAGTRAMIVPALSVDRRAVQTFIEKIADDFVVEQLHSAIAVMDHEPFLRAEQFVGNDEGADGVVARSAAGVANDMGVAFRKAGIFGGIEPCVHAGQNGEAPRRRQSEIFLVAEARGVSLVGFQHFRSNRHAKLPLFCVRSDANGCAAPFLVFRAPRPSRIRRRPAQR